MLPAAAAPAPTPRPADDCDSPGPPVTSNVTCPRCAWRGTKFAAYSSADMAPGTWRLEADDVFPDRAAWPATNTTYFSPSVVFNGRSGLYVLWMVRRR